MSTTFPRGFDLPRELAAGNTRTNRDRITRWVAADEGRLRLLMELYLRGDFRTAQLAAGVVCLVAQEHPDLMEPWLPAMVKRMNEPGIHDAVIRTGMYTLQCVTVPTKLAGRVAKMCFDSLEDISRPIAVRVFAMTVLVNLCGEAPELAREVELAITTVLPYGTGAFQARARRELRRLQRIERFDTKGRGGNGGARREI